MKVYQNLLKEGIISVNESIHEVTFYPDTSKWSNYYIVIAGTFESLVLANPNVHTVGVPLFFEFFNNRSGSIPIRVTFGPDYNTGDVISLPAQEVVSGIMLFDERRKWTLHTPWTCRGAPLLITPMGKTPNQGRAQIVLSSPPSSPIVVGKEDYRKRIIDVSGPLSSNQFIILPLIDGSDWLVRNNTTGGHTITVRGLSAVKGVDIPADHVKAVFTDGIGFYEY